MVNPNKWIFNFQLQRVDKRYLAKNIIPDNHVWWIQYSEQVYTSIINDSD